MSKTRIRRRGGVTLLFVAAAAAAVGGCGDSPTGPRPIEDTIFADALGIDLAQFTRLDSGVYVRDDVVGEGDAAVQGTTATLVIRGWHPDGSLFQPETEFSFTLGANEVIPGFEEGVRGLREGGTRTFIVPAELAYGDNVLIFEVELLEVSGPQ